MSLSLRFKLILQILPIFLGIVIGSAGFVIIMTGRIEGDLSSRELQEMAQHYAYQMESDAISAKESGNALATAVQSLQGFSRKRVISVLQTQLQKDSSIGGVFVIFEPNGFDTLDRSLAKSEGYGKTGRFALYWQRGQEQPENEDTFITGTPLENQYEIVIHTQKPVLYVTGLTPTEFELKYLTPIERDGTTVGVVGVDLSSSKFNQIINNLEIFKSGYGFLMDGNGTILAAKNGDLVGKGSIYQAAIQNKTTDFDTLQQKIHLDVTGSLVTRDPIHAKDATLFFAPVPSTGWGLVIAAPQNEMMESTLLLRTVLLSMASLAIVFLIFYVAYIAGRIVKPIKQMGIAAEKISGGDLQVALTYRSQDEIGQMANAFRKMVEYLQGMSETAQRISAGDLSLTIHPATERDVLGNAFVEMTRGLQETVRDVARDADEVLTTSEGLASSMGQSSHATQQISATIQQVARGASDQSQSVQETMDAVLQMHQAIQELRDGMHTQTEVIDNTTSLTKDMSRSISQVAENARSVTENAEAAAQSAQSGTHKVEETLNGMQLMKDQVSQSSAKVEEMGAKSVRIGDMVETIDEIASQTNLLALNAAIETARAEVQARNLTEAILNHEMIAQAHLINQVLCDHPSDLTTSFWSELCRRAGLNSICITDEDGVIVHSDDAAVIGFRFSDDPKSQTFPFRQLIYQKNGVFCQPPQKRGVDGRTFKYVGVSRMDRPGIVQVAFDADTLSNFTLKLGGFAVVSDEVRKLAEKSREAAQEIHSMTRDIQHAVHESVISMKGGMVAVEKSVNQALASGDALKDIQRAVETVLQQAQQSAKAAQEMTGYTQQLVSAMNRVGKVTQVNSEATERINRSAEDVTQAMDSLASLGEENGSAVEEVSATVEEISAQVEDVARSAKTLEHMAQSLRQVVGRFTLAEDSPMEEELPPHFHPSWN